MADTRRKRTGTGPKGRASDRVVAVTGAFGHLGRRLLMRLELDPEIDRIVAIDVKNALALAEDETQPAALLRDHPRLSAHELDLTTPGADRELSEILRRERVGSLIHLAFLSTPTHALELAHELETIGTLYALHAAAEARLHGLISLSSTMCYGARADNPAWITEDQPLRPPSSRTLRDKTEADDQARRFQAEHPEVAVAVARLGAWVPGAPDHFWTRLLSRRLVPAVLGYDPLLQFLHADDAATALHALWKSKARGAYNVVGRGVLPFSHVLTRLSRIPLYLPAGLGDGLIGALWSAQLVDMPKHFLEYLRWSWVCDDTRLREATGFVPHHDVDAVLMRFRAALANRG